MRFNRDYELVIGIGSNQVTVKYPIRVVFSATKSISGGLNKLNLKIYNLTEASRLKLVKDKTDLTYIPLVLSIGYQGSLERVFKGSVYVGSNKREGAELVSEIECQDGGVDFLNSFTSKTIKRGDVVSSILEDMPNTTKGKITSIQELIRPKVLVGSSTKLIEEFISEDQSWFIDNEQLYIIKGNEVVSALIPVVSAETGLLNTPDNDLSKVTLQTIMNPALRPGGLYQLISTNAPHLNGIYKIESMNYKGDTHGDDWSQTITGIENFQYEVLR